MARPSKPELPAESRTRTTADEAAMARYDKLRMYYSQDLREFTLENDKFMAFKNEVYSTASQALRELLLPEQSLRIWLQILSRKCTPTKAQRAELLKAFYRKQIAIPISIKKTEDWLLSWKAIMAKIIKHKISKSDHDLWGVILQRFGTITSLSPPIICGSSGYRRQTSLRKITPEKSAKPCNYSMQIISLGGLSKLQLLQRSSMVTHRQTHHHKLKKFKRVAAIAAKGVLPKSLNLLIRLGRETRRKRLRVTSPRAKAVRIRICCKLASLWRIQTIRS
jgi:hypothetical protein